MPGAIGFELYRSTTCGSYAAVNGVAAIDGATLTYTDNVAPGVKYCYVLTGLYSVTDANGQTSTQESGFSNEVSVTPTITLTPPVLRLSVN